MHEQYSRVEAHFSEGLGIDAAGQEALSQQFAAWGEVHEKSKESPILKKIAPDNGAPRNI